MQELQKAEICVYHEKGEKETITCMFNPSEYKVSENTGYTTKSSRGSGKTASQYVGGKGSSLSLTLYYDTTDNMGGLDESQRNTSVLGYVDDIRRLMKVEGDLHKPPEIEFVWGGFHYRGHLVALEQEFSYFAVDGKPLRAKLSLRISGVDGVAEALADSNNSPDRTKYRVVTEGMSLWRLAWEEYKDCEMWKEIARFNGLEHPLDVQPGQRLKLPAIES